MIAKEWLKENRLMFILQIVGLVLAGVVGYFSGVRAVDIRISNVAERVAKNETVLEEREKAAVDKTRFELLEKEVEELRKDNTLYQTIYTFLSEKLEEAREDTLAVLNDFIENINLPASSSPSR